MVWISLVIVPVTSPIPGISQLAVSRLREIISLAPASPQTPNRAVCNGQGQGRERLPGRGERVNDQPNRRCLQATELISHHVARRRHAKHGKERKEGQGVKAESSRAWGEESRV